MRQQAKKGLAALLAVLMLVSLLPVQAMAADAAHVEDDVVMYCLGPEQTDEMYLVCWPEYLESIRGYGIAGSCDAFDDDGSYVIQLPEGEDSVCFLYFDEDGEAVAQPETFTGADQTVTVKGHQFRAAWGGEPPQSGSVVDPLTLFPTKTVQVESDLRGLFPVELAEVKLADLLSAEQAAGLDGQIAWSYGSDSYQVAGKDSTIDLSYLWNQTGRYDSTNGWYSQAQIVILSKADPTATDVVRYEVNIKAFPGKYREILEMDGRPVGSAGEYSSFSSAHKGTAYSDRTMTMFYLQSGDSKKGCTLEAGTAARLGFSEDFLKKNNWTGNLTCTVYQGSYDSADKIPSGTATADGMWNGQDGYTITNFPSPIGSQNRPEYPAFTLVIKRGEKVLMTMPFQVYYYVYTSSPSYDPYSHVYDVNYLYTKAGTSTDLVSDPQGSAEIAAYELIDSSDDGDDIQKQTYVFMLKEGMTSEGPYFLRMSAYGYTYEPVEPENPGQDQDEAEQKYTTNWHYGSDCVLGAYVGTFNTLEAAQAAAESSPDTVKDIKAELFGVVEEGETSPTTAFGYSADFSNKGVTISIFGLDDRVWQVTVQTRMYAAPTEEVIGGIANPGDTRSLDTYFYVTGAVGDYSAYYMSRADDAYYSNGYQTIFLLDKTGGPVADGTIIPTFRQGYKVDVFAKHNEIGDGENATKEESGVTRHEFQSGAAIPYSAASERKTHLRNYWITFVTQVSGPKLFINGVTNLDASHREGNTESGTPIREVLMAAGGHHDIFVANIGDQPVKNLKVELKNAQNVKVDDYWDFGEAKELAAFTTTERDPGKVGYDYGELFNVTKIRLVPDGKGGKVSGILEISGDGIETQKIILSGTAGVPKITTSTLSNAVKYVPYSVLIQTNNMYGDSGVSFSAASPLPAGLELHEDGEIYGAPQRAGTYQFKVRMSYNGAVVETKEFSLEVLENTDYNVYHASDSSYQILLHIGTDNTSEDETTDPDATDSWIIQAGDLPNETFRSNGAYLYFTKVWLDGVELKPSQYTAEEGSTKIIQLDAGLGGNKYNGVHTIATEFREGGPKGTLKRTSQNFYVEGGTKAPSPSNPSRPSGSGGSSSGGGSFGGSGSSGSGGSGQTPSTSGTPMSFVDVATASWYYDDVNWAYTQGLMMGESSTVFAPDGAISQATIVTVLARMLNVNLDRYKGLTSPTVPSGTWYTEAAIWAQRSGILPSDIPFTGTAPIAREDMAILLQNYLIAMGVTIDQDIAQVWFTDAYLMSESGLQAFQVLYHYNIFRGVGGFQMDPTGTTTRAQFAALTRRLSNFTETYKQK